MKDKADQTWPHLLYNISLFQGVALFLALVIYIYGGSGQFSVILTVSLIISNLNGFSIWFFFRIFQIDWKKNSNWNTRYIIKSIAVLFLSILVATEIGMRIAILVLLRDLIPFFSIWHLYLVLMNLVVSAVVVLIEAFFLRLKYRLQRREQEVEDLRHMQLRTQLAVLKARLNPHFLFNSLNAILDLVYKAPQQVEAMVLNLAQIYRRVLRDAEREWATVSEEIELLEAYLHVESIRLGDRLRYTVSCPKELRERPLPSLLLQPLVENAVLHGIAPKIGGGMITVSVELIGERLRILIRDDGMGFTGRRSGTGFGLASIEERLKIIYPGQHEFLIGAESGGGTMVKLELP